MSAVILLGLLAAAITLGAIGIYHVTSGDRPTIQYGILLLILIGALMIWDQAGRFADSSLRNGVTADAVGGLAHQCQIRDLRFWGTVSLPCNDIRPGKVTSSAGTCFCPPRKNC